MPIDEWTANNAAFKGNIELLEWLETNRNILPDFSGADLAVSMNNIEVLDWLAQRGIIPTTEAAREATKVETLIWLSSYYKPTADWAITAISSGNNEILAWLETQGIGYEEISHWIKVRNIKSEEITKWLTANRPNKRVTQGRIY